MSCPVCGKSCIQYIAERLCLHAALIIPGLQLSFMSHKLINWHRIYLYVFLHIEWTFNQNRDLIHEL